MGRLAILVLSCTLAIPGARGSNDPQGIVRHAIATEQSRRSGHVLLKITEVQYCEFLWPGAPEKIEKDMQIDVQWSSSKRMTIEVLSAGKPIRRLRLEDMKWDLGDGTSICWDTLHPGKQLVSALWPYRVFMMHLFPLSLGGLVSDYETRFFRGLGRYTSMSEIGINDCPSDGYIGVGVTVKTAPRTSSPSWEYVFDREHGFAMVSLTEKMGDSVLQRYLFGEPAQCNGSDTWMMKSFRYLFKGGLSAEASICTSVERIELRE